MNPQIDAMIGQGIQAFQDGNIQSAELILQRVVKAFPSTYPALQILGLIKAKQENYLEAISYFKKALRINSTDPALLYNLAQALISADQEAEAAIILVKHTKIAPNHPGAWFSLGRCLNWLGKNTEALEALDRAIELDPSNSQTLMAKGLALRSAGRFEDAVEVLSTALKGEPGNFAAWLELGHIHSELHRYEEALLANEHAIAILPNDAKAWYNQGVILVGLRRLEEALLANEHALSASPDYANAWYNRGAILLALKRYDEAVIANERAIAIVPTYSDAWLNKGCALRELKCYSEALLATDQALQLSKENLKAWLNLGAIFMNLKDYEKAFEVIEKGLEIDPSNTDLWFNKALVLGDLARYPEAIDAYGRAKLLGADNDYLIGNLIHIKMLIADRAHIDNHLSYLQENLNKRQNVVAPFPFLSLVDDPQLQLEAAQLYVDKNVEIQCTKEVCQTYSHKKIRIGYFSSDLREHPVGRLIGEVVELHDKSSYETYAFSLLPAKEGDAVRARLVESFDHFISCDGQSDEAIAFKARECEIDIAIDLNGHTQDMRVRIFALGVAPIQINYLGYPGTMGAAFMDYIIADKTIIPSDSHQFYTEKVAYLPNSYLMYDSLNKVPAQIPTRAAIGIPDDVFVFCGFNNGYKISKGVVKSWIKILLSVENSILWLTGENTEFKKNILMEFSNLGVSSERIIFAPRVERIEDHLARLKQADLFLDAWPYNAHSTGMDVLNAGVPILTKAGKSFAARVGASLLTSLNLPELIAHSTDEYEAKAIQLANNPALLKEIKAKVQDQNARSKLFDTKQFTLGLESLYKQMYELKQAGLPAKHLYADS